MKKSSRDTFWFFSRWHTLFVLDFSIEKKKREQDMSERSFEISKYLSYLFMIKVLESRNGGISFEKDIGSLQLSQTNNSMISIKKTHDVNLVQKVENGIKRYFFSAEAARKYDLPDPPYDAFEVLTSNNRQSKPWTTTR